MKTALVIVLATTIDEDVDDDDDGRACNGYPLRIVTHVPGADFVIVVGVVVVVADGRLLRAHRLGQPHTAATTGDIDVEEHTIDACDDVTKRVRTMKRV